MSSNGRPTDNAWRIVTDSDACPEEDHEYELLGSDGQNEYYECSICGEVVVAQYPFL